MFNSSTAFFANMLVYSLQINLALAIFNMLPIPPLDGSKILRGLLPYRYEYVSNTIREIWTLDVNVTDPIWCDVRGFIVLVIYWSFC